MGRGETVELSDARSAAALNVVGAKGLPGYLGIEVVTWADGEVTGRLPMRPALFAPHGFVHGATHVALADSLCGYGCMTTLPDGAAGFTTVELKTNFLGSADRGALLCTATRVHAGRSTQVWDATVTDEDGRTVSLFRCTQMILWPRIAA